MSGSSHNPLLRDVLRGIVEDDPVADGFGRPPGVPALARPKGYDKILVTYTAGATADGDIIPEKQPSTWEELENYESRLEQESIELEVSKGLTPERKLCRKCRRHQLIKNGTLNHSDTIWEGLFGNTAQIICRQHCAIHRLILRMVTCATGEVHPLFLALDPEVQFVGLTPDTLPSGEVVLAVEFGLQKIGHIRAIRPDNIKEVHRQSYAISTASTTEKLRSEQQQVSISLLRKWLSDCEHLHGRICDTSVDRVVTHPSIRLLLIDVFTERLIKGTSESRYVALSYVWGKVNMNETRQANLPLRFMPGFFSPSDESLPRTIRDAIRIVRQFGEQYLWVDSMCIVQDDSVAKHNTIKQMDLIYSKALLTIVALSGNDANSALPGVEPRTREEQYVEVVGDLCLTVTPFPLPYLVSSSTWSSRGWTFQEKLLSRRCLYFTDHYVYWQCNKGTLVEGGPAQPKMEEESVYQDLNLSTRLTHASNIKPYERDASLFSLYADLVGAYTRRKLSFPLDILHAFSGLANVLQERFGGSFFGGMPSNALDQALLWAPVGTTARADRNFPTWSWAGWEGSIQYVIDLTCRREENTTMRPEVEYFQTHHGGRLSTMAIMTKEDVEISEDRYQRRYGYTSQSSVQGPDLGPNVLQFHAWTAHAQRFRIDDRGPTHLSSVDHTNAQSEAGVYRIQNLQGQHCGLIYLTGMTNRLPKGPIEFAMISKFGDATKRRHGPDTVNGPMPCFDEGVFPYRGKHSGLVNLLVIVWQSEIAARLTIAQIHISAWQAAHPEKKHIRLG